MITDNKISVSNERGKSRVYTSSKWFKSAEYVNVKYKDGVLELEKVYLDANKYSLKICKRRAYPNYVQINTKHKIKKGVYHFSDESTEDKAVIYINEN